MPSNNIKSKRNLEAAKKSKPRLDHQKRGQQPNQTSIWVNAALSFRDLRQKAEAAGHQTTPRPALDDLDDLTASIIIDAMCRNPKLTVETAITMLREFGF